MSDAVVPDAVVPDAVVPGPVVSEPIDPGKPAESPSRGVAAILAAFGALLLGIALSLRFFGGGAAAGLHEPSLNLVRATLTGAATLLVFASLALGRGSPRIPRVMAAGISLWIMAYAASSYAAVDQHAWRIRWTEVIEGALTLVALTALASDPRGRRAVLAVLLAATFAVGGLAIKERAVDRPAARAAYAEDPTIAPVRAGLRNDFESRLYADQASGPFLLPNGLGAFGGVALVLALGGVLGAGDWRRRGLLLVAAALAAATVWASAQKGGVFAALVGVGVLAALRLGTRKRKTLGIGAVVLGTLALQALIVFVPARALERLPGGLSLAVRHEYAIASGRMAKAAPLTGIGGGNYRHRYAEHKVAGAEDARLAHHDLLEALAESGLFGALGLLLLWGGGVLPSVRRALAGPQRDSAPEDASAPLDAPEPVDSFNPLDASTPLESSSPLLIVGAAAGALLLPALGTPYRSVEVGLGLVIAMGGCGAVAWRVLVPHGPPAERQGPPIAQTAILAAAIAFVAGTGLDFHHREPGLLALGFGLLALIVGIAEAVRPRTHSSHARPRLVAFGLAAASALLMVIVAASLPEQVRIDDARLKAQQALASRDGPAFREALSILDADRPLDPGALRLRIAWTEATRPPGDRALAAIVRVTRDRPDLAGLKRTAAEISAHQGRFVEAQAWIDRAAAADPQSPQVHLLRAEIQRARGEAAAARTSAEQALTLDARQRRVRAHLTGDQRIRAEQLAAASTRD